MNIYKAPVWQYQTDFLTGFWKIFLHNSLDRCVPSAVLQFVNYFSLCVCLSLSLFPF